MVLRCGEQGDIPQSAYGNLGKKCLLVVTLELCCHLEGAEMSKIRQPAGHFVQ